MILECLTTRNYSGIFHFITTPPFKCRHDRTNPDEGYLYSTSLLVFVSLVDVCLLRTLFELDVKVRLSGEIPFASDRFSGHPTKH